MDMKQRSGAYQRYIVAWSSVDEAERLRILEETVSEDVAYLDAMTSRAGRTDLADHLAGFQHRRPRFSFGVGSLLVYQDVGLANWRMLDTAGALVVDGFDFVRFDADGRISNITGFSNASYQQAV